MLLDCPECAHRVSDRAAACPSCGFPVAEHVAQSQRAAQLLEERASRRVVGEVDCVHCEARGFRMIDVTAFDGRQCEAFEWCSICEHTGRVILCVSTTGYHAVEAKHLEAFLAGDALAPTAAVALGQEHPGPHRFPQAGSRKKSPG